MNLIGRWFPVVFALPFLFATTIIEGLRQPAELGRWLMLAAASGLAVMQGMARGPQGWVGWVGSDIWALGFLAAFAATASWSIDAAYSLQRTISMGLLYVATFWYGWGYADRYGSQALLQMLLRTSAVILGLNLLVFGATAPSEVLARRFSGFFENPNNIGLICSISLPLAFSEFLRKRGGWQWAEFSVFFLSLLTCGSRTGLLSSFAGMLLIGVAQAIRGNQLAIKLGGGMCVAIALVSTTSYFAENIAREGSLETMSHRTYFWDLAKERYIPARPWGGHGFGTDGQIHGHYGISLSSLQLRGYGVMSSYYGLAVAVGIPLATLFFASLAGAVITALIRWWRDPQLVAYSATVIAGLLVGITESAIYSVGNCFAYLFWMVVGLMIRQATYLSRRIPMHGAGALGPPTSQLEVRAPVSRRAARRAQFGSRRRRRWR